ncbi:MAG: type II secretion system F family protein [Terracidiphilus sp.]
MGLIIGLTFLGIFGVVALLAVAMTSGAAQHAKQVHATLDSALATDTQDVREQLVDLRKSDTLSAIPWLHRRLERYEVAPRLQTLLYQAELRWTAGGLLAGCALCFMLPAYLAYARFDSLLIALAVGLLFGGAPFAWVLRKRAKRLERFQQGLPEALDLMVSALRAGQSFISAMGSVAKECADPIGYEFKACFEEQNFGLELKAALDNLIRRVPLQDLRIVATAIMIQKETGGNLAEVLDKTAHVIRERFRLKRQVAVHTAQGRLTGLILTLLPIVLGAALFAVNPEMMSILWKNPTGIRMLWYAGGSIVVGGLIIRHIVNMDV